MNEARCICCDTIIPEGRVICSKCEHVQIKIGTILQSTQATKEEVGKVYNFMEGKNDT